MLIIPKMSIASVFSRIVRWPFREGWPSEHVINARGSWPAFLVTAIVVAQITSTQLSTPQQTILYSGLACFFGPKLYALTKAAALRLS